LDIEKYFYMGSQFLVGHGFPIIEASTTSLRFTVLGRTPLGELSARSGEFYLTIYNTYNRQIYIPQARFELPVPASE
jgi:hypothetical protein